MVKNEFHLRVCAWIIAMAVPVIVSAQIFMPAIPQVSRTAQQAIVSITHSEGNGHWYIYYRTDRQKSFQVRKMDAAVPGKAIYHLPTNMLYGRNVEYFIVKEAAGTTSTTPVYTVVDANTNPIPEIYFQENSPLADHAEPGSDPLVRLAGSLSRADRLYQQEEDASAVQSTNGNLRLFRNINNEKFQFDFDSSFSFLSPTPAEDSAFNLASMMVRFKKGDHQIAIGDLAISQSEYTAPALNRRGLQYELSGHGLYFSAFLANAQQKKGFEGFGIPPAAANIMGAMLGTDVGSILKIRGLVLSGHDDLNLGRTLVVEENPFRAGNIFSFWGDLNLFESHLQLTGEYARSSFGTSATAQSEVSRKNDHAWRSGFTFNWESFNASANYRRIGENFNSIANLFQQNDREGIDGTMGVTIKSFSINVFYIDQKSYLFTLSQDGQHEKRASTNIGWQITPAWRIGSDFSLSNLEYNSKSALPVGTPDMGTFNLNGSLGYASTAGSFTFTLGKIKSGNFTSNFSGQLACSLLFDQAVTLSTVFSFQRNKDLVAGSNSNIYSININSEITFIPQWFTFIYSGSFMRNVGGSFDSTAIVINANLNLFLAVLFKNKIQPMLTAKGEIQSNQAAGIKTTNISFWLQSALSF
jgi:hypothetical protein